MSVTFLLLLLLRHHAEAVCVCVHLNEYGVLNPHAHTDTTPPRTHGFAQAHTGGRVGK